MAGARYVLLGLAPAKSRWFREVAQWANAGSIPAEFVKCLSAAEVRARLIGGRSFSALLVDATFPTLDRDLIDTARSATCPVVVVGGHRGRDWTSAGAAAVLGPDFGRTDLLDALATHAGMITRVDRPAEDDGAEAIAGWRAPLITVTGPGGTGASTVAIALAQGLASDVRSRGSVLLADLRLNAEQAMLHDAREVVPGVQELVDAFRSGRPGVEEVRALTFTVPERGYRLLLGIRRRRVWATIRPRAFEAALEGMRRACRCVVADVDPDLEGEGDGGSVDVEERHVMARTTIATADVVFIVGQPGLKGLHALARVITELSEFGVAGERMVPVLNRASRHARARAEQSRALVQLVPPAAATTMVSPVFLPDRRVDEALRDGVRLPAPLVSPLLGAYRAVAKRAPEPAPASVAPVLVAPGTIGSWPVDPGQDPD